MDIARPDVGKSRRRNRLLITVAAIVALATVTLGLSRLKPAAPSVDRSVQLIDTVKRGPLLRQVRGSGTLVAEEVNWIPAVTEGRVEKIFIHPGTTATVRADSVLLELSNPELTLAASDASLNLKGAEAEYTDLRVRLESQLLTQEAGAAQVEAEYHQAKLQAEADTELGKSGLVSALNVKLSNVKADELANRSEIEKKRLEIAEESNRAQLAVQESKVDQFRAAAELKRSQLEALRVRAGRDGVLQQLPVEVGQRVTPGTILAKVAEPGRLKAELKIAETQAKDIQIGQSATIDTRNGIVPGKVIRMDSASQNGTVTVDVRMEGDLPKGARPDLSVDGAIELENLKDALFVGRPAFGQENSTVGIFRLDEDGRGASRVQVKLGRSSVTSIEIVEGLKAGDQVILSDTSAWDAFDRIRLN
jgi:HlyD family secretion protein